MNETLIYSRSAYNKNKEFAEVVERTQFMATSLENHIELIQEEYPDFTVCELYTYNHSGSVIERSPSCEWDSSLDGMCAYKSEEDLDDTISEINSELSCNEDFDDEDFED